MISPARILHLIRSFLALGLLSALTPPAARAQAFELAGARARGMGGAFVAVADDASAAWWNPAGLPATLIFDAVVDGATIESVPGGPVEQARAGRRVRSALVAATFPVAGLSYARVRQWRLDPVPTESASGSRQERGRFPTARSLLTQHVGVSVAQSIGDAIVVGVTASLVRGGVSTSGPAAGGVDELFDRASEGPDRPEIRGDLGAGILVRLARIRVGLAARNLTAPAFTDADGVEWTLRRRVRGGVAVVAEPDRAGRQAWVVAFDADMTRDDEVAGQWRGIGAGVERWVKARRLGVRGGVEASTVGQARPSATGGLSVAVPGGWFLDVSGVAGAQRRRGWGLSAHVMF